jgi:tetratricopeptide (TPR) repeat protein/predicted Ser/Thr protein kinase
VRPRWCTLPSSVVSHYRLLNPLGTGGMGVVYRAEDTALGRTVALKFLSPQIVHDPKRVERFRDEARNASCLNHPNICTIYEVDEEDGQLFIAMEYVEGQPLLSFLRENGMALELVLRYGRQISAALEHAHERGIVHRDLKPVNIVVTPQGDAKILDFGLAKRSDPEELHRKTLDGGPTETSAGLTGTLPYMAPEQLEGREAGPRGDIWSLGVVLYEMASGIRPFRGENLYRLCTAIIQEPPPPLPEHVPAGLASVIKRCLEKEPARRYQRASELRAALDALEPSGTIAAGPAPRARTWRSGAAWIALGVAVLVGIGIGTALRNSKRHNASANAGIAVPERMQLAVLPASVGLRPEETAFDDGLVETLTSRLTQLTQTHPLAVIPASEVRAKKAGTLDAARAEFGVNLGLLINIQHAAGQARVNYSLVDARSHQELRGGTITAAADNPFALQDQVSESVAQALELELQPQEKKALAAHGTTEPAAYDFYLQGRGYLQNYDKEENIDNAISVFHRALEKDPGFAAAYAGLGEGYWRKFESTHDKNLPAEATRACQSATEKDSGLAEAHACLGFVYVSTGKYEQAVAEYQKAAHTEPTLDAAQAGLARAYESLNRLDEAEGAYQTAIALRPNYWAGYNRLAIFYFQHGKMDEAAKMFSQVISLVPDSFAGYSNLGAVRLAQGRYAEAIPLLEKSVGIRKRADTTSNLATAYFQLRRYPDAARVYEEAVQLDDKNYTVWGNLGDAYYWTPGRRKDAVPAYRKAIALAEDALRVNGRDAAALSSVSVYHAMLGERAPALDGLQRALRLEPKRPDLLLNAAITEQQLGDRERSMAYLERAVAAGLPAVSLKDLPNFDGERDNPKFQKLFPGT